MSTPKEIDWIEISSRLQLALDCLKLSVRQASKLANIGFRTTYKVLNVERTSLGTVRALADGLGLSSKWLIYGEGPEPAWLSLVSKIHSLPPAEPVKTRDWTQSFRDPRIRPDDIRGFKSTVPEEPSPFLECCTPPSTFGELVDDLAAHLGCHAMDVFEALRPLHNRVNPNPKD